MFRRRTETTRQYENYCLLVIEYCGLDTPFTKSAQGYSTTRGNNMPKLTPQQIVDLNKEYTFFSWSNQGQVNPIPVLRAEGVYLWDADGKR